MNKEIERNQWKKYSCTAKVPAGLKKRKDVPGSKQAAWLTKYRTKAVISKQKKTTTIAVVLLILFYSPGSSSSTKGYSKGSLYPG